MRRRRRRRPLLLSAYLGHESATVIKCPSLSSSTSMCKLTALLILLPNSHGPIKRTTRRARVRCSLIIVVVVVVSSTLLLLLLLLSILMANLSEFFFLFMPAASAAAANLDGHLSPVKRTFVCLYVCSTEIRADCNLLRVLDAVVSPKPVEMESKKRQRESKYLNKGTQIR